MSHDILGYNKAGKEIAYARFSMGNPNAIILYNLLDANEYYAGVSGIGRETTFTIQQMEKAMDECNRFYKNVPISVLVSGISKWDKKQTVEFIEKCFNTAEKEGSVSIFFG